MKETLITNSHWYVNGIGEFSNGKVTHLNVKDSMNNYFDRVKATMELIALINPDLVFEEDIGNVAAMIRDMTDDAKALLDRWWEENEGNGARRDHTPSERVQS